MDIFKKIAIFKQKNPSVLDKDVNELVREVAADCMQSMVNNYELNGFISNAWYTIKDTYNVKITEQSQLFPLHRLQDSELSMLFRNACFEEDIEKIKDCLNKFIRINYDADSSALTEAARYGKIKTLKFFIEDEFITQNKIYQDQIDFENIKGVLFKEAYWAKNIEILEYLIIHHNAEMTSEAEESLDSDSEIREEVVNIIENKYLNLILSLKLKNNENKKTKVKI